jgi:hypothetical protein
LGSVVDFEAFCRARSIRILERKLLTHGREVNTVPNLLGALAVYRFGTGSHWNQNDRP